MTAPTPVRRRLATRPPRAFTAATWPNSWTAAATAAQNSRRRDATSSSVPKISQNPPVL